MLRGFPEDFPTFSKKEATTLNNETGIFVRSEVDEISVAKKAKIAVEKVEMCEEKENVQCEKLRHVKFSGAPPVEYLTFPDSEYDRSPLNKPVGKWKR